MVWLTLEAYFLHCLNWCVTACIWPEVSLYNRGNAVIGPIGFMVPTATSAAKGQGIVEVAADVSGFAAAVSEHVLCGGEQGNCLSHMSREEKLRLENDRGEQPKRRYPSIGCLLLLLPSSAVNLQTGGLNTGVVSMLAARVISLKDFKNMRFVVDSMPSSNGFLPNSVRGISPIAYLSLAQAPPFPCMQPKDRRK